MSIYLLLKAGKEGAAIMSALTNESGGKSLNSGFGIFSFKKKEIGCRLSHSIVD
nr:hypothetical protein [Desulfobulbaceae bacterium]